MQIKFADIKDTMRSDCLILPVAAIRKLRSDHQFSNAISKAQWGRHQRDSLIHRMWEIGERGGFGNKENKLYLPSPQSRRKAEMMPDGDWQAHSFPNPKTNCNRGLNDETNSVFFYSELCTKGFGRIPFFSVFSVFCSFFPFFQFTVPFFLFFPFAVPFFPFFPFPVPFVCKFPPGKSVHWLFWVSGLRVQDFWGWGCQGWRFKVV